MRVRVEVAPEAGLSFTDTVMVVDVLRATTTAAALLERGLHTLLLAENLASAQALRREDNLLVGEDGGLTPDAFDIGNSPAEILEQDFSGKTAILTTSNGARAAHLASRSSQNVLLTCLNNASAACEQAMLLAEQEIAILCAGRSGCASPDDTYVAGVLASHLMKLGAVPTGTGVHEAVRFYHEQADANTLLARIGAYLEPLGVEADITVCAQLDSSLKVPVLRGKRESGLIFANSYLQS